jgi:hypothetical protein
MARTGGWRERLQLRFEPDDLEQRYRLDRLPGNRNALVTILLVGAFFQVINLPTDWIITGGGRNFDILVVIRLAGALLAVAGALIIRRLREPARFETIATWWGMLTAVGVVASSAFLPPDYTAHTAWSVFLVLAMYVVLPVPLISQAMVASVFSLGDAWILGTLKVLDPPAVGIDILTAHVCAHVLGLLVSWQYQRSRRDQFLARRDAELAHTQEQRALGELRVLQGILPICAHCKRIRTDNGEWSQVEVYVRRHSDADFSHGICPDCEQKFFESQG